ncbi:hypothetical protein N7450_003326 [Penicillium hetheringtonii]|uniref:Ubiquitin-like domain-containing protein n=1 Tax=Penicillium hetheringtonii TaxID=911720 RepID=A0AAD6DXP4_9EURO|nr:hypothetical protein N7450_003326 [Penicillium hetheringtonii]
MATNPGAQDSTPSSSGKITLHILCPEISSTGRFTLHDQSLSDTVAQIKARITESLPSRPTPVQQRLIYHGKPLTDDRATLASVLGPVNESFSIHLALPPKPTPTTHPTQRAASIFSDSTQTAFSTGSAPLLGSSASEIRNRAQPPLVSNGSTQPNSSDRSSQLQRELNSVLETWRSTTQQHHPERLPGHLNEMFQPGLSQQSAPIPPADLPQYGSRWPSSDSNSSYPSSYAAANANYQRLRSWNTSFPSSTLNLNDAPAAAQDPLRMDASGNNPLPTPAMPSPNQSVEGQRIHASNESNTAHRVTTNTIHQSHTTHHSYNTHPGYPNFAQPTRAGMDGSSSSQPEALRVFLTTQPDGRQSLIFPPGCTISSTPVGVTPLQPHLGYGSPRPFERIADAINPPVNVEAPQVRVANEQRQRDPNANAAGIERYVRRMWMFIRMYFFAYMVSESGTWMRIFLVASAVLFAFFWDTDMSRQLYGAVVAPVQRHLEGLAHMGGPADQAAQAANQDGRNNENAAVQGMPGGSFTIPPALVPGIGERQVEARNAAEAERARLEQEQEQERERARARQEQPQEQAQNETQPNMEETVHGNDQVGAESTPPPVIGQPEQAIA